MMMRRVAAFADKQASVVMDYRYLPAVAIAIWSGPVTSSLVAQFFGELERLQESLGASQKYALVVIATESCELPAAARFEAAMQNDRTRVSHGTRQVGCHVVLDNPLLRGAVRAVGWRSKTGPRSRLAQDLRPAFDDARRALEGAGMSWPLALSAATYIAPALPAARAG
jgi:hypothetical protein